MERKGKKRSETGPGKCRGKRGHFCAAATGRNPQAQRPGLPVPSRARWREVRAQSPVTPARAGLRLAAPPPGPLHKHARAGKRVGRCRELRALAFCRLPLPSTIHAGSLAPARLGSLARSAGELAHTSPRPQPWFPALHPALARARRGLSAFS